MSFEKDYTLLLGFAKRRVSFFGLNIEPEELVNDAYVKLHDKPYSLNLFYRQIKNFALIEKHGGASIISWGVKGITHSHFTGDNTCKDCKQTMPVSEFPIYGQKGKQILRNICKKCVNKRSYKSNLKQNGIEKSRERVRIAVAKYVAKDKTKYRKYQKEWYKSQKENLTDTYIRRLLQSKYSNEYILYHPELIIERRKIIVENNTQTQKPKKIKPIRNKRVICNETKEVFKSVTDCAIKVSGKESVKSNLCSHLKGRPKHKTFYNKTFSYYKPLSAA